MGRLFKILKWAVGLAILLAAFVFIGLPLLANTEEGRRRVGEILSKALHREVKVNDLEVGFFFTSLDVGGLSMANPEGYPAGPMVEAGRLHFDVNFRRVLEGNVQGTLRGEGLRLHVIRKDGKTNLEGLGGGGGKEASGRGDVNLDLDLEIKESKLVVEDLDKGEKLVVDGVGLEMRFTNRGDQSDASLKVRIESIDNRTLRVRDIAVDARQAGDFLEIEKLRALLGDSGALEGSGRMRVRGGDDWQVKLDAKDVGLDAQMRPFVASVWPFAAAQGGQVDGRFDGGFELAGAGLTWEAMKPTLAGTGKITFTEMRLPSASLLGQLAALAGRADGDLALNDAGAQFHVGNGWLDFQRISASGKEVRYDLAGRVSLDGKLALTMDLMPLVKQFGGGSAYREAAKYTDKLEVRIEGTTGAPKLKAPQVADLAKGVLEKKLEKEVGGLLDKIKKK